MPKDRALALAILVSALGYLVDIYDIMIFSVVRVPSLKAIGVADEQLTSVGLHLLNCQLVGMLVGGLLWGVLGDKRGRITVLFGSIFLYSVANLANAFVANVTQYEALRFVAGVGLAGELGAGVTLVSELMPPTLRGLGTMMIAVVGVLGAVLASYVGDHLPWQQCYILGGMMGFLLLAIRVGVSESRIFQSVLDKESISKGNLFQLLARSDLRWKFLRCLMIGAPVWIFIGLSTTIAPELGREMGLSEPLKTGAALQYLNFGIMIGDIFSTMTSQFLRSRKKAIGIFMALLAATVWAFATAAFTDVQTVLWVYFLLGLWGGYWALFIVNSAEQFGTNLRATVATSAPNLVRALVVPLSWFLQSLHHSIGYRMGLGVVALSALALAFVSLWKMKETFGESLDFVETI